MTDLDRLTAALSDRYTIERTLGAGGMATVYLAHDVKHDRKVALKVLRPELSAMLGAERFVQEIKTTANLQHPHILPLFDSGRAGGQADGRSDDFLYYVMPYVEGSTLRQHLVERKVLPVEEAVTIAVDVASALAHAHEHGVIHRDIKPENILFSGGKAIVADFGIAQALSVAGGNRMTQTGLAIGTPSYMSPEQAAGEAVDGRSDEYALASLLYEMLAGEPPYTGPNARAIIAKRATDPVPSARRLRETVSQVLDRAISKALAKHPTDRYPTIAEFAAAVSKYDQDDPNARGRNPLVTYGLGLAALVIVAMGLTLVLSRTTRQSGAGTTTDMQRVVVFPFSVRGTSEVAYLGDGMVDLLSTKLDGAGNWRSADPRAVMSAVTQEGGGQPSLERASQMVAELGADLYVLGNIVEVGESMLIDAALYRPGQSRDPIASASAEGNSNQVLALVDELAAELLQGQTGGSGARLTRLALVTTDSLPALKWYLNGVREFRAARFPEAWAAFSHAVAADTAFALAWYQLSVTSDWLLRTDLSPWDASNRAMLFADRLSERDRQLLEALRTVRGGQADEAERRYRAILGRYPDDVEAWFQLGELLFHMGPRLGGQLTSSSEAWRQVLRLEPDQSTAYIHMARVAASIPDSAMLDSMSGRVLALVPSGDRSLEMEMLRAFSRSDTASRARAGRLMRAGSEATLSQAQWSATFLPIDGAIEIAIFMTEQHRSAELRAVGYRSLAFLHMAKGHRSEALAQLDAAARLDSAAALTDRALIELAPFQPAGAVTLRSLRAALRAYDAAADSPTASTSMWIAVHNGLQEEIRAYLLGLLDGHLQDADPDVADLETFVAPAEVGTVVADWRRGVLASDAWVAGDHGTALEHLEAIELEGWYQYVVASPFISLARERFLLATLLEEAGRTDEALRWYGTFEDVGAHDRMYIAPSHFRRARIHQRLGNLETASVHYRAFIELWRDADPEFQPLVEEARARLGDVLDDER